jgi:hypothetical protein
MVRLLNIINITASGGPTAITLHQRCYLRNNDGSISINGVTGGSAPYEYSIDGGGYGNTTNFTSLGAGAHTIAVRDAMVAVYSTTVTLISTACCPDRLT